MRTGIWLLLAMAACNGETSGKDDSETTGGGDDTGGGGGGGDNWVAAGQGFAWFVDGEEDNSVLHLEMGQVRPPKEGEIYYGRVSQAGANPIIIAEIPITTDELIFEYDLGINAVIEGYDTFEAYAGTDSSAEGAPLWRGQVSPEIYTSIQNLLVSSDATPGQEGSLRSLENYIERLREEIATNVGTGRELSVLRAHGEKIANAIDGTEEDYDDSGTGETYEYHFGVLNQGGYIDLILSDLGTAVSTIEPTDPIAEFANYAYDCTQLIEGKAEIASRFASTAAVTAATGSAEAQLLLADESLGYSLLGQDGVDEGEDVDPITEGTLECAIYHVSEMMRMPVLVP